MSLFTRTISLQSLASRWLTFSNLYRHSLSRTNSSDFIFQRVSSFPRTASPEDIGKRLSVMVKEEDPDFEILSGDSSSDGDGMEGLEDEKSTSSEIVDDDEEEDDVVIVATAHGKKKRKAPSGGGAGAKSPEPLVVPNIEDCIFDPEKEVEEVRNALLEWYDCNHRILPWRRNAFSKRAVEDVEKEQVARGVVAAPLDLGQDDFIYYVWVCEIMSQQTQISRVCEYFSKWIKKWPTVRDLAGATQDEVNDMWAGLGYYRRARFLLEGAKYVVHDLDGKFPKNAKDLQKIPGIGAYTSCAIASQACGEKVAVVDGNVVRVLARMRKIAGDPKNAKMVKLFADLADRTLDPERPGDFNQAVMELGATVCIPNGTPACDTCPVSSWCQARKSEKEDKSMSVTDYPSKSEKAQKREERVGITVVRVVSPGEEKITKSSGKFLLVKRPPGGLLAGLWEFPLQHVDAKASKGKIQSVLDDYLNTTIRLEYKTSDDAKLRVKHRRALGEAVHVFSHIRMTMCIEELCLEGELPSLECPDDVQWITYDKLSEKGLSSGVKKVLSKYNDHHKKSKNSIAKFFVAKT